MQIKISKVGGREILDSRGMPTVEATVYLSDGTMGVASVPSGTSRGSHEAYELRDGDIRRYSGKGVLRAVENIRGIISPALSGRDAFDQYGVDSLLIGLDGTQNKSRLGANATLAVSMAAARAAACALGMPLYRYLGGSVRCRLPVPMMNILNGGAHASNNLDIQEFMVMPIGAGDFSEGVRMCAEVYAALKLLLIKKGKGTTVGDEGGYAPDLAENEEAIELILEAIHLSGYDTDRIGIGLDAASSEWVQEGRYRMPKSGRTFTGEGLVAYWEELIRQYPIVSLEDGAGEDDILTWQALTETVGGQVMLVGDDLFVTNPRRLERGIGEGVGNAILIKPNQIGTLTEVFSAVDIARRHGYSHIISHRSGETGDTTIADLAVATDAPYIKAGAPARGERVAKYNRLFKIASVLGDAQEYGE